MNQKTNYRIITFGDLWRIFVHRLWIIVLVALLTIGILFAVSNFSFVPKYSSTATLYILRQTDSGTASNEASSDFSLALKVVNDCTYLLKSHTVLDEVISKMGLNTTYEDLYENVSTLNPEDTRILEVTVVADSPNEAKSIVDEICTIGSEKIENAMGFQQVNLYEYGTTDSEPSNKLGGSVYAIAGVLGAVLTYVVFLIIFILDDRIRTDEDIERVLGISVLGCIPNADADEKKKGSYGYYKAYSAHQKQNETNEEKNLNGKD